MWWKPIGAIVSLACLVQPGMSLRIGSVSADVDRTQDSVLPNAADSSQLQLRVVLDENGKLQRAEVDVFVQSNTVVLLLSQEEVTRRGVQPEILKANLILPMARMSPLTCEVSLEMVPPEISRCAQAVVIATSGQVLVSDIVELGVASIVDPEATPVVSMYRGLPVETYAGMVAICRIAPLPSTYALEASVTVRSSDWGLSHHLTCLDEGGARVFLVFKVPGPGEGLEDVVETHSVGSELGEKLPAQVDVYIAVTKSWDPSASSLVFRRAEMN